MTFEVFFYNDDIYTVECSSRICINFLIVYILRFLLNNYIFRSILLKKVEAYTTILEQLMAGMEKFRLLSFIREKPDVFRMIFCKSTLFSWTYDSLVDSLKVVWSDDGSNKKASELETYRMFIDMCDNSYHQG